MYCPRTPARLITSLPFQSLGKRITNCESKRYFSLPKKLLGARVVVEASSRK